MKRFFAVLTVGLLVLLLISPKKAFATYLDPAGDSPYMTDYGSDVSRDTFDLSETPFAFIGFDVTSLNTTGPLELTWSWYFDNDLFIGSESQRIDDFGTNPLNIWNTLDNWDSLKQVGDWKTAISWENRVLGGKGGWGSQLIPFTVTPEPASSFLFLLGAATLGLSYYRRKRKTA